MRIVMPEIVQSSYRLVEELPIISSGIADFQTPPPQNKDENRHYFEAIGAHANRPNRNYYQFSDEAIEQMRVDYAVGKTLTVNHTKGGGGFFSSSNGTGVGLGSTIDAVVKDGTLYIQSYILRGLTFPTGELGTSEQFIAAIVDGFLNSVSVSVMADAGICSICKNNYRDYEQCTHSRGREYIVGEGENKRIERAIVIITKASALELSLVQEGADPDALITKKAFSLYSEGYIDKDKFEAVRSKYGGNPIEDKSTVVPIGFSTLNDDKVDDKSEQSSRSEANQEGDSNVNPEEIKAMQDQNAALQKESAALRTENSSLQTELSNLRTENTTLQSEKRTLESEKSGIEQQLELSQKTAEANDSKIKELEKEISDNEQIIADGKEARKEAEEEYISAYVKSRGTDCTNVDKERQANFAKKLPLKELRADAKSYLERAKLHYPEGRQTLPTNDSETGNESENSGESQNGAAPLGVGLL